MIVKSVQQQLDNVFQRCHDTGYLITSNNVQTLQCTLDNRATVKAMLTVTFYGSAVQRTNNKLQDTLTGITWTEF